MQAFSSRLLAWWDGSGRKDLPWQHPRTPYRVWVSEIMLQQTQVATVLPYFERWMRRFPDLHSLASAPLDDVLAHWAGLGYYARARNLHRAAQLCVERHGAELPLEREALCALPGIGTSTANAIRSQATGQPAAVLDGNVRRVLARHAAVDGWTGSAAVQARLWHEAEARLPRERGADYTQAIMDLGALICTRTRPDCLACPVSADCAARAADRVAHYPAARRAVRVTEQDLTLLVLRDTRGRVLLERRPPTGIWGGLWSLPEAASREELASRLGLDLSSACVLATMEHRLSHRLLRLRPLLVEATRAMAVRDADNLAWFRPGARGFPGVPRPVARLLAEWAATSAVPGDQGTIPAG